MNTVKASTVCGVALGLLFAGGAPTMFAQTPTVPPAYTPGKAPHVGGNSFEGPKDVVYLPTRPLEDTRADMYFGDWRHSEPNVMFGALVVRDILTPGDNLSPTFPGAVLEHAKFLSYGKLEAGARTVPSTLKGYQVFFYVDGGEGEVSGGGRTEPLHKGSALLIPEGLEFTLRNTGEGQLTAYMVGDPTYPGFKPLPSSGLKDEAHLPHSAPADPSPFTNPGAGGHWAHITHGFFNQEPGSPRSGPSSRSIFFRCSLVSRTPISLGTKRSGARSKAKAWPSTVRSCACSIPGRLTCCARITSPRIPISTLKNPEISRSSFCGSARARKCRLRRTRPERKAVPRIG